MSRAPAWYTWFAVVLLPIVVSMGVLVVSLRVNERSVERERAARVVSQQTFCQVFILLNDFYQKASPPTDAGKKIAQAIAVTVVRNCR